MRINLLSSFAAGILLSTTITGAVYFNTKSGGTKPAAQISENDMKHALEAKGYVVQTKAEYNKQMEGTKPVAPKQAASKQIGTQIIKNGKTVTQVVVNVSPGMTSYDVGKVLFQAGMVKNAFDFTRSIHSQGLEKDLRPGTYKVDTGMTYSQVVLTIFKK